MVNDMTSHKNASSRIALLFLFGLLFGAFPANGHAQQQSLPNVWDNLIVSPDKADKYFLYYAIANKRPPVGELASANEKVKSADEFHRKDVQKQIEQRILERVKQYEGIRYIELASDNDFGEYDDRYGELTFRLSNNTALGRDTVFDREVAIWAVNGGDAATWSLTPAEAQEVLRKNDGKRDVRLVMMLEIVGAPEPNNDYAPLALQARVLEYEILGGHGWGGPHLGHVSLADASVPRPKSIMLGRSNANGRASQSTQVKPNLDGSKAAFQVVHDHGSTSDSDNKFCIGTLYIFPDKVVFDVESSPDPRGRTDPFTLPFADILEVKKNFFYIHHVDSFHIKSKSSKKTFNFIPGPGVTIDDILAAFPNPPRM